ncbi:MAG TPA: glycosyltransferase [Chitinophagaceae bacterium]|nr:glycosyltransferase [Chitinophagaceae bacterium]
MRIAVIHQGGDITNDYAAYLSSLLDESARQKGYAIYDYWQLKRFRENIKSENALLHIIVPDGKAFTMNRWYKRKLHSLFKKYRIDAALCLYGISANSTVPQFMAFFDKDFLPAEKTAPYWKKYAAKNFEKSVSAAKTILTYSETASKNFTQKINLSKPPNVIPFTADAVFEPMEWHNKIYIKSRYADSKEYFLSVLPDDDEKRFTDLLKAFSKFKKWQQSNMKLLLLPKEEQFANTLYKKLDSYKYREDVTFINDADTKGTADIFAAAYTFIHNGESDADLWHVAAAIKCAVPVIAYTAESLKEYCGEALLPASEKNSESLGEQIIHLYKNEGLRTNMSETAAEQAKKFPADAAEKLWFLVASNLQNSSS